MLPSQAVSASSIRIVVLSNDKHLNGMLAIDNLNAEKYYNVSIAKLYFESFPLLLSFYRNPVTYLCIYLYCRQKKCIRLRS